LAGFWQDFGRILQPLNGRILAGFWPDFWQDFGRIFGRILAGFWPDFWPDFGRIFGRILQPLNAIAIALVQHCSCPLTSLAIPIASRGHETTVHAGTCAIT